MFEKGKDLGQTTITYEEFNKIKPYIRNRDVMPRIPKMRKYLSSGYQRAQSCITIGVAIEDFGPYKKGDHFLLNGCTRQETWRWYPELVTNHIFYANVYYLSSKEEADGEYDALDNKNAAETSNEINTGLMREAEMTNFQTPQFAQGRFNTIFTAICRYGYSEDNVYLNNLTPMEKLLYFKEELTFLDPFQINKSKRYSVPIMTALIMLTKKYGTNNEKLIELINNFKSRVTIKNDYNEVDGVHYIYNDYYDKNAKDWSSMSYSIQSERIGTILYCFEKFLNDEFLKKTNGAVKEVKDISEMKKHFSMFMPRKKVE
jgi:hypothetical protein